MRVLIVGCGYIGVPLGAELVRLGHDVSGLRRSTSAQKDLLAAGIKPLVGDVSRPEDLAGLPASFEWVVNCVASGGGGGADDYRRVYLEGTRNLIGWLGSATPLSFVYTSSTSVYGQNDASPVSEASPAEPPSETARVLVETEELLLEAAGQRRWPAVILRVAGIYGPGRGHGFRQYLKNEARIEGNGRRFLNMIHRDDVVGCIIAALRSGRGGEVYNAVDDEPVTEIDFFEWLAGRLGRGLPAFVPADAGAARKRGVTNKKVSNRKLKEDLGYRFKYPTFREGYAA
ncbi:MAG: NAD-dependent epimerase/dehydratase family protein, partial [Verrucomicrobiota bacterium]